MCLFAAAKTNPPRATYPQKGGGGSRYYLSIFCATQKFNFFILENIKKYTLLCDHKTPSVCDRYKGTLLSADFLSSQGGWNNFY